MPHGNEMICQPVTLSGYAEWPKVADAVIEAKQHIDILLTGLSPAYGNDATARRTAYDHRRKPHHYGTTTTARGLFALGLPIRPQAQIVYETRIMQGIHALRYTYCISRRNCFGGKQLWVF
jgi:hypothetical protein